MEKLKKSRQNLLICSLICIVLGLGLYIFYFFWIRPFERTDDAYVGANYISITSQVSGTVSKVYVTDNQYVTEGDLLFEVEPDKLSNHAKFAPYSKIYAPFSGQISNCHIFNGQFVKAGSPQFALISPETIWVDANFKETQLENVRIGQYAEVVIDMYPRQKFLAEVISISGATGAVFSLLPPQNATGNWVKVTQRIPVRVLIKSCKNHQLTLGASAHVSIRVK